MKLLATIIRNLSLMLLHRFTKDEEKKNEIEKIIDGEHKMAIVSLIVVIIVIIGMIFKGELF